MTLGISGRGRICNFDVVSFSQPPPGERRFWIRKTADEVLEAGAVVSHMTTTRNNIHMLHAGKTPLRGIDISTRLGPHQGFSFVDLDLNTRTPSPAGELLAAKRRKPS